MNVFIRMKRVYVLLFFSPWPLHILVYIVISPRLYGSCRDSISKTCIFYPTSHTQKPNHVQCLYGGASEGVRVIHLSYKTRTHAYVTTASSLNQGEFQVCESF
ncbi:hypothetical protein BJ165DRAFT_1426897 [Panaeolus papilionaceus]|nr:hypothetical protein BJ165DRAFT_1426897 [Panaeolus papilionaceus]